MSSGSESAPQEYQVRQPVRLGRSGNRAGARTFLAAVATVGALSLGFVASGCGGGGGGGGGGSTPTPSPSPSVSSQSVVTGRVVDLYTNTGVRGVTVSLGGQSVTTATDGSFTVTFPAAFAGGTLTLTAPSGSKGLENYLVAASASKCTASLTVTVPAVSAGQTYGTGTLQVYDKDNQGQLPPAPPCLSS